MERPIEKAIERLPVDAWIRTCQECFHKQQDTEPKGEITNAYRNRKCRKCKSEALDYGTQNGSYVDWTDDEVTR